VGTRRLLLRGTLSNEDRCELATAVAADRARELRHSMRPKPRYPNPAPEPHGLDPNSTVGRCKLKGVCWHLC
jgi:hypothetical protein